MPPKAASPAPGVATQDSDEPVEQTRPERSDSVVPGAAHAVGMGDFGPAAGNTPRLQRWRHGAAYILRRLGLLAPMALLVLALPIAGGVMVMWQQEAIHGGITGYGAAAPVLFILAAAVLGGLSLLPTHGLSFIGGLVFGFTPGVVVTMAGIICGAAMGFAIKRRLSQRRVMGLIGERPESAAVHAALVGGRFWRAAVVVTLVRLSPAAPFAMTNLVMAATGVRWAPFMLGTAAGMLPRCAAVVYVGSLVAQFGPAAEQTQPTWSIVLSIVATIVAVILIGAWSRRALRGLGGTGSHHAAAK